MEGGGGNLQEAPAPSATTWVYFKVLIATSVFTLGGRPCHLSGRGGVNFRLTQSPYAAQRILALLPAAQKSRRVCN